ncbi:hypothetical protein VTN02DRAFT_6662 [Thermoascus thermophilus]
MKRRLGRSCVASSSIWRRSTTRSAARAREPFSPPSAWSAATSRAPRPPRRSVSHPPSPREQRANCLLVTSQPGVLQPCDRLAHQDQRARVAQAAQPRVQPRPRYRVRHRDLHVAARAGPAAAGPAGRARRGTQGAEPGEVAAGTRGGGLLPADPGARRERAALQG